MSLLKVCLPPPRPGRPRRGARRAEVGRYVRIARERLLDGRPAAEVAQRHDISERTVRHWVAWVLDSECRPARDLRRELARRK